MDGPGTLILGSRDIFSATLRQKRPLLLLLYRHSSHYSPHAIRFAAKEKVIIFSLIQPTSPSL